MAVTMLSEVLSVSDTAKINTGIQYLNENASDVRASIEIPLDNGVAKLSFNGSNSHRIVINLNIPDTV